ncbi:MAG: hypothetical protein IPM13_02145 [Phycisphaerales bacterium]|nr:hypothetical protein [Phycisphaerales bacterium]
MMSLSWRLRCLRVSMAVSGLGLLTGCGGLSDQQLTSILQTVLTTGLNTLITSVISLLLASLTGQVQ